MENLITCQICGKQSTRIYGRHLKHHGLTSEEYLKLYPGAQLYTESDHEKTIKNSGLHMKEEKYKKMFSEMFNGKNNPNSKSRTTDEQRKERSPFSKSFIKYKNENESVEFSKKVHENITLEQQSTRIEYYLNKGYNVDESQQILSERQRTFTLEKCIEKYGEIDGLEKWNERQRKWSEKIETKYRNGDFVKFRKENYSGPELELFENVIEKLNLKNEKIYYGKKQFFRHFKNLGKTFSYDFVFDKKIIEFYGNYWHCNPKKYNGNYFHKYLQMFAYEIWEKDKIRINSIEKEGYKVLIIWENDYNKNKKESIQKCIDFLKNKNNM